jgi:hypothetical protein
LYYFVFKHLIQNFIDGRRRGGGRGPDALGHKLHVRQGGWLGETTGMRGALAPIDVVVGLKSIVIFLLNKKNLVKLSHNFEK